MARFHDLPLEIRQEIYRLACLPEPAVYCLSNPDIFELPRTNRLAKSSKRVNKWRVIKRRYPTAAHLCQESRSYVGHIQRLENVRAARLGVQPLNYQIGRGQRVFEPEIDVVFVRSWRLLRALDRHVTSTFPFPDSFLDVKYIALDAEAMTYDGHWLPYYHIFRRFPKLRNLSIVFQGGREFAETRLCPQLARISEYDMDEGSEEELVCQRVEADLRNTQLIDPEMKYRNHLVSPVTQLVAMGLGLVHKTQVSAAQLTVGHSRSCHSEEQDNELDMDSDWEWPDYSLLYEPELCSDLWWEEELQSRFGKQEKFRESICTRMLKALPCKWAVLTPLYYFFLLLYLYCF